MYASKDNENPNSAVYDYHFSTSTSSPSNRFLNSEEPRRGLRIPIEDGQSVYIGIVGSDETETEFELDIGDFEIIEENEEEEEGEEGGEIYLAFRYYKDSNDLFILAAFVLFVEFIIISIFIFLLEKGYIKSKLIKKQPEKGENQKKSSFSHLGPLWVPRAPQDGPRVPHRTHFA